MKKTYVFVFALICFVVVFSWASNLQSVSVHASTDVSGIVSSDTTWTKTNSPYILTGPVAVNKGATLTIEPGVTVNLVDYYLQVNGTLYARGSILHNIIFTSNPHTISDSNNGLILFNPGSNSWNEQAGTGCIVENAVLNITCIAVNNESPKINNNSLSNAPNVAIAIIGGSPIISNNIITGIGDGILIDGGSPLISNNTLDGKKNGLYINGANHAVISDNIISDSNVGVMVWAFSVTLERNLILNNQFGIDFSDTNFASATIQNNTIASNSVGIRLHSSSAANIMYNNIQNNSQNSIYLNNHNLNVNAADNWWGTTNTQAMNQSIHDFKNDFNLGTVTFIPFLAESNPQAVPNSNAPLLTITPSPTETIFLNQTQSPTQSISSTPNLSPSPSIPEFPLGILLPAAAVTILIVVITGRLKKNRSVVE